MTQGVNHRVVTVETRRLFWVAVCKFCARLFPSTSVFPAKLTNLTLDIWLAVHHSTTFFIITNLIHKFLVRSHKLYKIKFLYMFRAQSAHHQEVNDVNCTYAASGIVTVCK